MEIGASPAVTADCDYFVITAVGSAAIFNTRAQMVDDSESEFRSGVPSAAQPHSNSSRKFPSPAHA